MNEQDAQLQEWMRAYGRDVWNFAFSLISMPHLADDITQDVFVRAYENMQTFQGTSSVKTWLLAIARNAVIDHQRSAFWRKVTLVEWVRELGNAPSAEREALRHEFNSEVWQMVLQLPTKLREVLVLHAHHQLSHAEIAATLQIPENTVKSRLHRARTRLSALLAKEADHHVTS